MLDCDSLDEHIVVLGSTALHLGFTKTRILSLASNQQCSGRCSLAFQQRSRRSSQSEDPSHDLSTSQRWCKHSKENLRGWPVVIPFTILSTSPDTVSLPSWLAHSLWAGAAVGSVAGSQCWSALPSTNRQASNQVVV